MFYEFQSIHDYSRMAFHRQSINQCNCKNTWCKETALKVAMSDSPVLSACPRLDPGLLIPYADCRKYAQLQCANSELISRLCPSFNALGIRCQRWRVQPTQGTCCRRSSTHVAVAAGLASQLPDKAVIQSVSSSWPVERPHKFVSISLEAQSTLRSINGLHSSSINGCSGTSA